MSDEATNADTFHMVKCWLEKKGLAALGKELGLPPHTDTNYLVHCALGHLFDDHAPKPFSVDDAPNTNRGRRDEDERFVRVLGYADATSSTLHDTARDYAGPAVYKMCDWRRERFGSKKMPQTLRKGRRLRFELRACPVVRKAGGGPKWNAGQELDAFLSHVWELDDPDAEVAREDVYRDWLERQLDLRGGAEAHAIGMDRFSIERMTRRSHGSSNGSGRTVHTIQRPDVTLTGTLSVTDGSAFADLLKSGIGRHKSFGYGMLKVRRA